MTTPATFQTRVSFDHVRNTAAGFTTANPVLGYGVIGLETDSGKIKVGNGTTAWSSLPYSGGGPVEWSAITGKPSTFTPATHTHAIADVTGLQTALDAKATPADVTAAVSSVIDAAPAALDTLNELAAALGDDANFASTVTTALSAKAPLASPTFTGTVSGVTKAMVGLGNVDNTSDASKPISTATQTALDAKAAATHTHVIADVTGLQTALDGKQAAGSYAATVHTHAIADVTGLQTALDGKAASSHTHTSAAITDFTTAVQAAAPATTDASLLTSGTLADARLSGSVVLTTDSRLSNSRTPTAHASSHQTGGADTIANVVASPAQLTADQNDYAIGTGDIFRVSASAARNITGVVAGTSGQAVLLVNVGTFAITLKHQSTSSAAANRLVVPWAGDYVMSASGGAALLVYDATDSRWRVV